MQGISRLQIYGIVAGVVIVLFIAGSLLGGGSFEVAGCSATWPSTPQTVTGELCPNPSEPCTAEPFVLQHNAIVNALVCACGQAADGGNYGNPELNRQIEEGFNRASGFTLPVRDICEGGGGGFMVQWLYG